MDLNPVISMIGRRLKLGVIGGGSGSFIGAMHRQAAQLDDRYELVAGVLSSDASRGALAGKQIGLAEDRIYQSVLEMIEIESNRDDGIDIVAIMTPNDSHFEYAMAALDAGIHVICDKPMTNSVEEAEELSSKVQETGLVFCLTHSYTGYPMVRQAKAMVQEGYLGEIRLIQVEYVQGGNAVEADNSKNRSWRFDSKKSGPSLVMGDIGTHAHNLIRFISGLEITEVAAEVGSIVPNRNIHDYANAMLRLSNGSRGSFWVTQAAAGVENCLSIRVSGSKGTIEWMQEHPQVLDFKPINTPAQKLTPNGPGTLPLAARSSRIVAGHPEGLHEAFANLYSDVAEVIACRLSNNAVDPLAMFYPDVQDGVSGVRFVDSVLTSSEANGIWVRC